MFRPPPFKDAEKNTEAPERNFGDHVVLTLNSIWFYRRLIGGLLAIVGLGFFISYLANKNENEEFSSSPATSIPEQSALPQAEIGEITALESQLNEQTGFDSKEVIPDRANTTNEVANLIADGDVKSLIDESLRIRDAWRKQTPMIAYMLNADRLKISRRLMELETTQAQQDYTSIAYIESLSNMDSLNVQHKLNVSGIREAIQELDQTLVTSKSPAVCGMSHLALAIVPANEFYVTGDVQAIKQFDKELDQRLPHILSDRNSVERLCHVVLKLLDKYGFESETLPIAKKVSEALENNSNPEIEKLSFRFREAVLFQPIEPETFNNRIKINDQRSRDKVQRLYEILADHPDSSARYFQLAVNAIREYQSMSKFEDAAALAKWLREISSKIKDPKNRETMISALDELTAKMAERPQQ